MISEMQGLKEAERDLIKAYRMAQLIREVRVLRQLVKELPATGTTACNVCFRDYPHAADVHADDQHYLSLLPESEFDATGYL